MGFGPFFVCGDRVMGTVERVVESTLRGMGFELVDTQVLNHGRLLRIFIDKPGGVTIDDCAGVSRHFTHVLAVEGVDYDRLEVSSPGLDRPLRRAEDFARFSGRRVDVRMRLPDANGQRHYVGTLRGVQDGVATLGLGDRDVALPLDGMDRARLVPETGRSGRSTLSAERSG